MKLTMTKIAAAAALAFASNGAMAVAVDFTSANFTMYDPTGAIVGIDNTVSAFVDWDAMTFGVSSSTPFFGLPWTASGGTLFGPGSYTISTVDAAPGVSGGDYNVTVGANQIGGHIDFAWGGTTGIDVFNVWDVVLLGDGTMTLTSTDIDGDGILGLGMVDGPFPGFSANFNFPLPPLTPPDWTPPEEDVITPSIPEASTYAMMLAGLGLVGAAAARRQRLAAHVRGGGVI